MESELRSPTENTKVGCKAPLSQKWCRYGKSAKERYGHLDPDLFGEELVTLAKFYNDAYLCPESNNHGHSTIRAIMRKDYWNIYYQKNYNKLTDDVTQKPGWNTNKRTKPMMIDSLSEFIRESWLKLPWDTLISECFTYVKDENGGTNAQKGCHDDTVMALAIALQLLLEGKGENYAPELPDEKGNSKYWDGEDEEEFESDSEDYIECAD